MLRQFACRTKQQFNEVVDFSVNKFDFDVEEFVIWYNHPKLQQYMIDLYYKKGGTELSFSYTPLK